MPKVRIDRSQGASVQTSPIRGGQMNVQTSDETFGGGTGLAQTGAAFQSVLDTTQKTVVARDIRLREEAEKQKLIADNVAFQDADLLLSKAQTVIDTEARKMQGKNAGGAVDFAGNEWKNKVGEIRSTLVNDDQKLKFDESVKSRESQLYRSVQNHMGTEFLNYQTQSAQDYMDNEYANAIRNYTDPESIQSSMDNQESSYLRLAEMKGFDEETREKGLRDIRTKTHSGVIDRMLAQGDSKLAKDYYEANKDQIDDATSTKVLNSIDQRAKQIEKNTAFVERVKRQELTHDLINQANNGVLTGPKLEEAFLTKQISNTTYNSLQDNVISPVGPTSGTDKQTYYELTRYLLSDRANPEEAINRILNANSQGKLSRNDQKKLYEMHIMPTEAGNVSVIDAVNNQSQAKFDQMKAQYDERVKAINEHRRWFSPAFKTFDAYFTGPTKEDDVADATQQLIDSIQSNKIRNEDIPAEADKILGQSNLKKHPEWMALPKNGRTGTDRYGNKVIVYPDGRVVRAQ
jgi:hypothetical protein